VPGHRPGPQPPGAAHRHPAAHAGQPGAGVHRGLGHEHDRDFGRGGAAPAELRAEHERLGGVDGGVRVAGRAPGRHARLEHQGRLGPEPGRVPQYDVGQLAHLDRTHLVRQPVRHRRVDGQLGQVPQHPLVVVRAGGAGRPLQLCPLQLCLLHQGGHAERPAYCFPRPSHALRVRGRDRDDAEVVQRPLGRHRAGPDPVPGQRGVALRVQAVHQRDHVQVLGHRVPAERQRGIGGGGHDVRAAGQFQHVRRMPAAAARRCAAPPARRARRPRSARYPGSAGARRGPHAP